MTYLEITKKKLRIEQWKNEPADIFAMRAFSMAYKQMKPHERIAAATWIYRFTTEEQRRQNEFMVTSE